MIILYQQRLSLSGSTDLAFRSAPQSAPKTDVRPLPNALVAARSLSRALELTLPTANPRAHLKPNFLVHLKSFGPSPIPLYNPHRTR
jgi:hypothetical protein